MSYTIGSTGFIGTGSSIITDFVKEFSDVDTFDKFEFRFIYGTDGLLDLKHHLFEGNYKYQSGTVAINRFLKLVNSSACKDYNKATNGMFKVYAEEFINRIVQGSWYGSFADRAVEPKRNTLIRILNRLKVFKLLYLVELKLDFTFTIYPIKKIRYSIKPDNFDKCAKKFLTKVFKEIGLNLNKNIALNQIFPGNNPEACFPFLNSPRAIIVDRDPRDLYLQYKMVNYYSDQRQQPAKDVNTFIDLYKRMRENQPYIKENDNIMIINFEDMIYEYERTSKKIMAFCNITNHVNPKKFFDPSKSIANTQFFKQDNRYQDEINVIEKELKEYLYDFDKYDVDVSSFPKPFDNNSANPEGRRWKKQEY